MSNEFDFYNRIVSRWDVWAKQSTSPDDDGRYGYYCQKDTLTRKTIDDSLLGNKVTIGAYTVKPVENTVTYPLIDIDNHDGLTNVKDDVKLIYEQLIKIGLHPFIEGSGGGIETGAHVCLICKPTPAEEARKVLTGVLSDVERKHHEVFPKQTSVNADGFGNLVKLPFQFNNRTKTRSQILNPETFEPMERQQAIEYLMKLPDSDIHGVYEKEIRDLNEAIKIQKEWDNNGRKPIVLEAPKADIKINSDEIEQFLSNPKIKPCVVKAYNDAWKLHGIGSEGNDFRVAAVGELISWDASDKILHEYFKIQDDYDQAKTQDNIKWARKISNPTRCPKILSKCPTLLSNMCETCTYYKKPKPKQERETKTKQQPVYNIGGDNDLDDEYHKTDWGYAQRLVNLHGEDFHFCRANDKFLVYDGKIWNDDKQAQMELFVRDLYNILWSEAQAIQDYEKRKDAISEALKAESASKMSSILQMVKSEPGIPILPERFDKNTMLFNVQNGTIDLRTGTLRPHSKADYLTKISPVVYDASAKCPTWLKFLDKIFQGNKNIIEYIQRRAGYILTGETSEEDFTILYGIGSNGKSVYTGLLEHIMGDYSAKVNVETIQETYKNSGSSASSDVARLKGKRYITVSEPEKGIQLNESRVKDWTGRDKITARYLYQEPFEYRPELKMDIYTNHKPRIKGQDNGIWRRVKFIPFEVRISEDERDVHLSDKLKAESAGVLNWMIEGCLKWQIDGLKTPTEILQATEEYKEEQDYLGAFFSDCCDIDKNRTTPLKWIFLVYQAYCQLKGLSQQNHITFPQTLEERGFKKVRQGSGQFFKGIGLKPTLTEKIIEMESQPAELMNVGVQVMYDFLIKSLENASYRDSLKKPTQTYRPTLNKPTDNIIEKKEYKDNVGSNAVTDLSKICGICGNPLTGNSEDLRLPGLGRTHPSCKRELWTIKALHDVPTFVCIDEVTRSIKADEIKSIPAYNAVVLINRKMAMRVEA